MQFVEVTRSGPVTTVTLNRPEVRNAINVGMHFELQEAFDQFAEDPEQLICLVTGAGEKAFSAGSDVRAAAGADKAIPDYPRCGYGGITARFDCNKPIIALVNGLALGGGFEIALSCDIIIAADDASFGLPEPLVGAIALAGGLHRLARALPPSIVNGLVFTSRRLSAAEALRYGIASEVVPRSELMSAAHRWCEDILKASPVAIQTSKAVMQRGLAEASVEAALAAQVEYPEFRRWEQSHDLAEGLNAFAERRAPVWRGD